MGKVAKKLPEEYKVIAQNNGISLQTVYGRLQRGWDLDKAVNKIPSANYAFVKSLPRDEGTIAIGERKKTSRSYSFNWYEDLEEVLESAVLKSGLTRSDFICTAVEYYLNNVWINI
jgi:hypothetical protein